MEQVILLAALAWGIHMVRRDIAESSGISRALWIPTIWAGIALSRSVSYWIGFGGGSSSLEGSPLDRLIYGLLIVAGLVILAKRHLAWSRILSDNWPIVLFYGYLLVSVLWADSPFVSFKRWFKQSGNIVMALVILTELGPQQAIRAVFTRCAYFVIPLSIIFIRYFPALGRHYGRRGTWEPVGVTDQKNSLGSMVLVCGIVLAWEWIERSEVKNRAEKYFSKRKYVLIALLVLGAYLLRMCDSKTAIVCFTCGLAILFGLKMPAFRARLPVLVPSIVTTVLCLVLLDSVIGIEESFFQLLGRNATLTGRTDVWRELLALGTDPIFGTGFCSFWDDQNYLSRLPEWVGVSAHNAFLETYLDGGLIGVCLLILMLVVTATSMHRHLRFSPTPYSVARFVTLFVIVVSGFSESTFSRRGALEFLFLATAIQNVSRMRSSPVREVGGMAWAARIPRAELGRPVAAPTESLS